MKNLNERHIEDLELELKSKFDREAALEAVETKDLWPKVKAIMKKVALGWTKLGLPAGLTLQDYRIIKNMFYKIKKDSRGKNIVSGDNSNWIRANEVGESLKDQLMHNSVINKIDSEVDILDYLLNRYLPEQMADESMKRQIRIFFMEDLSIIPMLG
ncbi:hypothetical protein IT411_00300 [Candidatus Peregrinibacteria bacterium]|nr:hypothetical protein [Candidatus Peregrinibacteria bacterium]